MARTYVTPLMLLTLPTPGQEPGPDWANDLNTALESLDSHDHTAGKGTPVPATGIYIGSDLNWNGNNIIGLRSTRFTSQSGALALTADKNCVYFSNGNFFVNDGNGAAIQLTASGGLNAASIGGIGGDYASSSASVSYSNTTKTFSFTQAASQTAKMYFGDIAIAETAVGAQAITIKSPASLATAYTTTLPTAIPTSGQQFLVSDATGQQSYLPYNSTHFEIVGSSFRLKDDGITTAKILNAQVTNAKLAAVNEAIGPKVSGITYNPGLSVITDMAATITTVGRPVVVECIADGTGVNGAQWVLANSPGQICGGYLELFCDGTLVNRIYFAVSGPSGFLYLPPNFLSFRHAPAAGTHTYTVKIDLQAGGNVQPSDMNLWVREL